MSDAVKKGVLLDPVLLDPVFKQSEPTPHQSDQAKLSALAAEIGTLLAEHRDARLRLARALAEAKEMVDAGKGTNLSWRQWCQQHVLKRNGEAYTESYLRKMTKLGAAPEAARLLDEWRLKKRPQHSPVAELQWASAHNRSGALTAMSEAERSQIKRLHAEGKSGWEISRLVGRSQSSVVNVLKGRRASREELERRAVALDIQAQVARIDAAWDRAGPEARRQWLHAHNFREYQP